MFWCDATVAGSLQSLLSEQYSQADNIRGMEWRHDDMATRSLIFFTLRCAHKLRGFKLHLADDSTLVPSRLRWRLSGRIGWYLCEWAGAVAHSMLHLTPLCVCICRKVVTSSNQLRQTAAELRDHNETAVPHHRHPWTSG